MTVLLIALALYVVQLVCNACWSYFFFIRHSGWMSTVDAVLLCLSVGATMIAFWQLDHVSGLLFVPYFAWVSFATALTISVWRRNPTLL